MNVTTKIPFCMTPQEDADQKLITVVVDVVTDNYFLHAIITVNVKAIPRIKRT